MLMKFLNSTQENSKDFSDKQWSSTYWDKEWLRPDKLTSNLNDNYAKEIRNSEDFEREASEKQWDIEAGTSGAFEGVEVGAERSLSLSSASDEQKREIRGTYFCYKG